MNYFLGKFEYALDDDNRLSIPAKFRKVMTELNQTEFIISKEQKNCITMYPYLTWKEQIGDRIAELAHSSTEANKLRRLLGMNTTEVKLHNKGRIKIPSDYLEHAGIDKKVVIIGSVDTIQLWNPGSYDKLSDKDEKSLMDELEQFGI